MWFFYDCCYFLHTAVRKFQYVLRDINLVPKLPLENFSYFVSKHDKSKTSAPLPTPKETIRKCQSNCSLYRGNFCQNKVIILFPCHAKCSVYTLAGVYQMSNDWCYRKKKLIYPVKVWANTILMVDSPECLTMRLTVSSQWSHCYTAWRAHRLISQIGHSKLTVWDANSRRIHKKATAVRSSLECAVR